MGICAAFARLSCTNLVGKLIETKVKEPAEIKLEEPARTDGNKQEGTTTLEDIIDQLSTLKLEKKILGPFDIVFSNSFLTPTHPALVFTHPLPCPSLSSADPWPTHLQSLCKNATQAILKHPFSEIPEGLPQNDLYLSPGSNEAIFGALGAVCEAVDLVSNGSKYHRAFVAIRPPGHHCTEADPMGFCFVNNVVVGAAHAHQNHGINRIIIIDIDLHHGNGTQEIVWRINEAANQSLNEELEQQPLQIFYCSLHDIHAYPCEDGDPAMIQAASLNILGGHNQYISNIHLESWNTEQEFYDHLFPVYCTEIFGAATKFIEKTKAEKDKTMIFISAGMDASHHESKDMNRGGINRTLPTSFYHLFAQKTTEFADKYAQNKIISVLEGGYSNRALTSASLAFISGLDDARDVSLKEEWWSEKNLKVLERLSANKQTNAKDEDWVRQSFDVLKRIEAGEETATIDVAPAEEKKGRVLRERKLAVPVVQEQKSSRNTISAPNSSRPLRSRLSIPTSTPPETSTPKPTTATASTPPPAEDYTAAPAKIKFVWKEGGIQ